MRWSLSGVKTVKSITCVTVPGKGRLGVAGWLRKAGCATWPQVFINCVILPGLEVIGGRRSRVHRSSDAHTGTAPFLREEEKSGLAHPSRGVLFFTRLYTTYRLLENLSRNPGFVQVFWKDIFKKASSIRNQALRTDRPRHCLLRRNSTPAGGRFITGVPLHC